MANDSYDLSDQDAFCKAKVKLLPKQSKCFSTFWDTNATHRSDKFVTQTRNMAEELKLPQSANL